MEEDNRLKGFMERYASGMIPWDDDLPPPELMDLAAHKEPGRALDLGCGYGRSSIYLAQHGWEVDGIDFVPQAVRKAGRKAAEAGIADRVHFHAADVSDLSFLDGPYDLALDIGCMHSMPAAELIRYRDGLLRLLSPGALYLLFAHLADTDAAAGANDAAAGANDAAAGANDAAADANDAAAGATSIDNANDGGDAADAADSEESRWIKDEMLLSLFAEGFVLDHAEFGVTQVEDKPPWRSAWFLYRRTGDRQPGERPASIDAAA